MEVVIGIRVILVFGTNRNETRTPEPASGGNRNRQIRYEPLLRTHVDITVDTMDIDPISPWGSIHYVRTPAQVNDADM